MTTSIGFFFGAITMGTAPFVALFIILSLIYPIIRTFEDEEEGGRFSEWWEGGGRLASIILGIQIVLMNIFLF